MKFLDYAPILHISALTGERTPKVLETIDKVAAARKTRVPTPALNKFVESVTAANPPVSPNRRHVRILYAAQGLLHQRRDDVPFLVRALPGEQAPRGVRLRWDAHQDSSAPPQKVAQDFSPALEPTNVAQDFSPAEAYT
jgi:hypothetical protein